MEESRKYPIDFVTYLTPQLTLPVVTQLAKENTEKAGFYVLPITGDKFNIIGRKPSAFTSPAQARKQEKAIKVYQAPYKHIRDITIPKMNEYMIKHPSAKGFFIAEGDLCLKKGYTFSDWVKEYGDTQKVTWMGYKKVLRAKGKIDYIVGNFFIYVPRSQLRMLTEEFEKQKREIYSDRFFTRLVNEGKMILNPTSIAGEIEHISAVAGGKTRKADCHLNSELPKYEKRFKEERARKNETVELGEGTRQIKIDQVVDVGRLGREKKIIKVGVGGRRK
tara:strand:+ start:876 stop:1706 length:831 start_codon:yes stop_codon:yes gene_type:complete